MKLTDDEAKALGKNLMNGALMELCKLVFIGAMILLAYGWIGDHFNWGLDDSDKDGRNRSGLRVHKDHKTSVEYLSTREGFLIRREEAR